LENFLQKKKELLNDFKRPRSGPVGVGPPVREDRGRSPLVLNKKIPDIIRNFFVCGNTSEILTT
jgi:hypothetical protein